jgi:hypothetical protein
VLAKSRGGDGSNFDRPPDSSQILRPKRASG